MNMSIYRVLQNVGRSLAKLIVVSVIRFNCVRQESPAVADKPARRLRKVCTVYVRAVGL